MAAQLFQGKDHSIAYRLYRPTYPQDLFDHIKNYFYNDALNEKSITLAIDVACGSGQATATLSSFCEHVIGLDVSETQIQQATQKANIEYRCQPAEDLSFLQSNSVDLITVATALHWFDRDIFFKEVDRVLHLERGVLAVWTYNLGELDNPQADAIYREFFFQTLDAYWDKRGGPANDCYESIVHSFPYQSTLQIKSISHPMKITIEQLIGFIESTSAFQTYRKQQGEQVCQNKIETLREKLMECYNAVNHAERENFQLVMAYSIKLYLMKKCMAIN